MTADPAVLFRDDDLIVRHHAGRGGAACVVTFDSYTDVFDLDRSAFGEPLFAAERIDAVHVLSRDNRWYQYPAMLEAMAAVAAATRGYDRVVAYGSSMGAYAALRLAGAVRADAVLALSPQWTIDPARAPWETRWPDSSRTFADAWERATPPATPAETVVIFDPLLRDRRHVRALAREGYRFHPVEIPGGGHPVAAFLAEVGLLRPAILDLLAGRFDPDRLRTAAMARRAGSAQALLAASSRVGKARISRRLALLEGAAAIAPENPIVLSRLALELSWAGRADEALATHARALALQPGQPTLLMHLSCSHEIAGDRAAALGTMAQACATPAGNLYRLRWAALQSGAPREQNWPGWLRRLAGRRPRRLAEADV